MQRAHGTARVKRLWGETLGCARGGRAVFAGLSFSLDAGEALLVTGRNGAGKSSLLRMIAGLLSPAAGRLGCDGGKAEMSVGEQAHYLGHLDALKPSLSVAENLSFWSRYLGACENVTEPLTATGLDALKDFPAAYLSAGQRRRLSIARLVAVKRPLWLLDEPASALDTTAQAMLAGLMKAHLAQGGLIVAAVHGGIGLDGASELKMGEAA